MFEGKAEEAMKFYTSLFEHSSLLDVQRYGPNEGGPVGTIKKAVFTLAGQEFICIDSPIKHGFGFTASMSLFVNCVSESEIDRLFASLCGDGKVMMPLAPYPFSKKFGWVADKYGVSWQLTLG